MRTALRGALLSLLMVIASTAVIQGTAVAKAYCERFAGPPQFSGHGSTAQIKGLYEVVCTRKVSTGQLYGRIKEDRTWQPDAVHDTELFSFTDDKSDWVQTVTCQNQDMIFIEAQINDEAPTSSSRRQQFC